MAEKPAEAREREVPPVGELHPCPAHQDNLMELFCETCEELICRECTRRGPHSEHEYGTIEEVYPKHRDELVACLEPVYEQIAAYDKAIAELNARRDRVTRQQDILTRELNESARQIHEALETRKEELIAQLDEVTDKKLQNVATQQEQFAELYRSLDQYYGFVRSTLATRSETEILAMSEPICEQASEISAVMNRSELFEPCERADQEFDPTGLADLEEKVRNFGRIAEYVPVVCHENCRGDGPGLEFAVVGEVAKVTVRVIDQEGREYVRPVSVTFELMSADGKSKVTSGEGKQSEEKGYDITYLVRSRGEFKLHVRVEEKEIIGSPFTVRSVILVPDLREPWGVAISDSGNVIVTESAGHCVSVFSSDTGERVRSFGSRGNGPRQLDTPCGVALTATGDILVCDSNNHRLRLFSPLGVPLETVGSKGKKSLQFNEPVGVAVHPRSNKIYVTEFRNNRVQILNEDFTFSSKFGQTGSGCGEFMRPYGVAFDSQGRVYVTERYNHRVQVFSERGEYLEQFGVAGDEEKDGKLHEPIGIAIDSQDCVYVCDTARNVVRVFTLDGQHVRSWGGGCGQGAGHFQSPFDVAVDRDRTLYIADSGNGCVQII